jgi:hypothetical protein
MPVYECPKCGRTVELPEGIYYCEVCGPSVRMLSWMPYRIFFSWSKGAAEREAEAVRKMGYEARIVKEDNMWRIYIKKKAKASHHTNPGFAVGGKPNGGKVTFTEAFAEASRKISIDPDVSEILKKIGPAFPSYGPHYYYADMIEHMRWALALARTRQVDNLVRRHLLEIYTRRMQLLDELHKRKSMLRYTEWDKVMSEISRVWDLWEGNFEEALKSWCE